MKVIEYDPIHEWHIKRGVFKPSTMQVTEHGTIWTPYKMEMMKSDFKPVVRNVRSNDLYFTKVKINLQILERGKSGIVTEESTKKNI